MATVSEGTANPLVIIPQSHFLGRYSWIHRDVYIYNPCNYIIHRDIYIYI